MQVWKWCDACQRTITECEESHDRCEGKLEREYEREKYNAYLDGMD